MQLCKKFKLLIASAITIAGMVFTTNIKVDAEHSKDVHFFYQEELDIEELKGNPEFRQTLNIPEDIFDHECGRGRHGSVCYTGNLALKSSLRGLTIDNPNEEFTMLLKAYDALDPDGSHFTPEPGNSVLVCTEQGCFSFFTFQYFDKCTTFAELEKLCNGNKQNVALEKLFSVDVDEQNKEKLNSDLLKITGKSLISQVIALRGEGILHSDLHPGNVLIDKNTKKTKIIDFGLACDIPSHNSDLNDDQRTELERKFQEEFDNVLYLIRIIAKITGNEDLRQICSDLETYTPTLEALQVRYDQFLENFNAKEKATTYDTPHQQATNSSSR